MPKFRKKPVEIEAMQWDGTADGATRIIDWILSHGSTATYTCSNPDRCAGHDGDTPHAVSIRTLEGTMRADLGDWVIREPFPTGDRQFYPCKPGIFAATYEPVTDPAQTAEAEPAGFQAIDKFIRLNGPEITLADDEILIEGLRVEEPARLTVHAGRRRLNLQHNALHDLSAIDVCRDEECPCQGVADGQALDAAYRERAHLVALLAAMTPGAVIAPALDLDEPGWWIAYLNVGGRQASWHINPRDALLFAAVEHVGADDPRAQWDGHTTEDKYAWIAAYTAELDARHRRDTKAERCIASHCVEDEHIVPLD